MAAHFTSERKGKKPRIYRLPISSLFLAQTLTAEVKSRKPIFFPSFLNEVKTSRARITFRQLGKLMMKTQPETQSI